MKLNPNKKSKTKQNLVLGTEQSIEFEERIKWRVWRRGRLAWLALSLSLSLLLKAFTPNPRANPKNKSFGEDL